MNKCEKCNIYLGDNTKNCPLCGASVKTTNKKMNLEFVESEYYNIKPKKQARLIIRNIFVGISILILCIFLITAIITQKSEFFVWPLIIILFSWTTIFRFIFWPSQYRIMLTKLSLMLCVDLLFLGVYCSYYTAFRNPDMSPSQYLMALLVVFTYVLPSIIFATKITFLFIVMIRKTWYEMAFSIQIQSIFEIFIMVISCSIYYTNISKQLHPYYPIIIGFFGITTIIASLVFKPRITLEEFKKRFFF